MDMPQKQFSGDSRFCLSWSRPRTNVVFQAISPPFCSGLRSNFTVEYNEFSTLDGDEINFWKPN